MHNKYFSKEDAEKKLGKMVISLREFSGIPIGSVGRVASIYGMKNEYGLDIRWLFIHTKKHRVVDGFSKDEYKEFLQELE